MGEGIRIFRHDSHSGTGVPPHRSCMYTTHGARGTRRLRPSAYHNVFKIKHQRLL